MTILDEKARKKYEELVKRAAENPEDEQLKPVTALDTLLKEIERNGLMEIIDLDPYFGHTLLPLQEQTDLLAERYPEEFAFFKKLLEELQEEIEIHFEVTDLYEDEEFEQFVEDVRTIKSHYTDLFREEHRDAMRRFVERVLEEIA